MTSGEPQAAPQTMGRRVRHARQARRLSRPALGGAEFSPQYIRTIEEDRFYPSRPAQEVLARRLALAPIDLFGQAPPSAGPPDLAALDEDLRYVLDYVKGLYNARRDGAARDLLDEIAAVHEVPLGRLALPTRYRWHRVRGLIYLRTAAPEQAVTALQTAWGLAQELGDIPELVRTRNALGVAYFQQDQPQHARLHHEWCLHAIQLKLVKDVTLRMTIYYSLATDYWALNDPGQAIGMYKEALHLLADMNDPGRRASVCWGLNMAYLACGQMTYAEVYASQALQIYEALQDESRTGQVLTNLAEVLIQQGRYAEARCLLDRALALLAGAPDGAPLSTAYEQYADLELRCDHLAQATAYADQALQASRGAGAGGPHSDHAQRAQAGALRIAALVADRCGQAAQSDALFAKALALAQCGAHPETIQRLEWDYAGLLADRGAHAAAIQHYRTLAQPARRSPYLQYAL